MIPIPSKKRIQRRNAIHFFIPEPTKYKMRKIKIYRNHLKCVQNQNEHKIIKSEIDRLESELHQLSMNPMFKGS